MHSRKILPMYTLKTIFLVGVPTYHKIRLDYNSQPAWRYCYKVMHVTCANLRVGSLPMSSCIFYTQQSLYFLFSLLKDSGKFHAVKLVLCCCVMFVVWQIRAFRPLLMFAILGVRRSDTITARNVRAILMFAFWGKQPNQQTLTAHEHLLIYSRFEHQNTFEFTYSMTM